MKKTLHIIAFLIITLATSAQEIQCSLSVTSNSIQGTNKIVFENMRTAINDFIKNQIWTNDKFDTKERIECNLSFNITDQISSNEFKGTLTVQLRRPVYNTAYNTTTLNLQDPDIQFKYDEGQTLVYNPNAYDSNNLVPIIAFYVYFMLGMDYDTFSPNGGTEYFRRAETIVQQAQSSTYSGWKSYDGTQNRYWLVNNVLDDNHRVFRTELYNWHRRGLDQMAESVETGREVIYKSIDNLKDIKRASSRNAYLLGVYFTAKADEIVNIFSEAPQLQKDKVLESLQVADAGNMKKYANITNNK